MAWLSVFDTMLSATLVIMKLNPDDQFNVNENSVRVILKPYALSLIAFEAAKSGIEKWKVDLTNFTCTYYDKKGNTVLTEQIPQ